MRKLRAFFADRYYSLDYQAQEIKGYRLEAVGGGGTRADPAGRSAGREAREPLRRELEAFVAACRGERVRQVDGRRRRALATASRSRARRSAEAGAAGSAGRPTARRAPTADSEAQASRCSDRCDRRQRPLRRWTGSRCAEERRIETPLGEPSDAYILGELDGRQVAFLPRHGRGHRLLPTELNFRANIYGFKKLGVELPDLGLGGRLDARSSTCPGDIVVPDQFFDRTRHRPDTFFGDGLVAHVSVAHPVCPALADRRSPTRPARRRAPCHRGGSYVNMEGPQFSTRAESMVYRTWGVDVIGMTNLQEAKLAREAEICLRLARRWSPTTTAGTRTRRRSPARA